MKNFKNMAILLFAVFAFVGRVIAQNNTFSKPVNTVINNYLALKDALAGNDGDAASAKAKLMLASLNELPVTNLSATQKALVTKLEYDSRHISEVNRLPHQREHFASLSENMYLLVKGLKQNQMTLYRQYCSMTKKYFLSENEKSKDPYMGMTSCSKVIEIITFVKQ